MELSHIPKHPTRKAPPPPTSSGSNLQLVNGGSGDGNPTARLQGGSCPVLLPAFSTPELRSFGAEKPPVPPKPRKASSSSNMTEVKKPLPPVPPKPKVSAFTTYAKQADNPFL